MADPLYLVKIPLLPGKLVALARARQVPMRDLDEGYLCHALTRELWQDLAPAPFRLQPCGRTVVLWGYTSAPSDRLVEHARTFGDPALLGAVADLESIASKPVNVLPLGRAVGFEVRVCPVVRLSKATNGHRGGAEIDAFLARCFANRSETEIDREQVYIDWLAARMPTASTGISVTSLRVTGMTRDRFMRRTQGDHRQARYIERPDVTFQGIGTVVDGAQLLVWLGKGVGRHRAFGFGAVLLVPPGFAAS